MEEIEEREDKQKEEEKIRGGRQEIEDKRRRIIKRCDKNSNGGY